MAAGQGQAPNVDTFDAYFKRADLDRDGRISGTEAVAFFQGSNLPKETLALVWSYAAGRNNSLGRNEFYNALRLVTVAQSGRQLTADIVNAALYGPAAAKIPAPKINLGSGSAGQMVSAVTSSLPANNVTVQSAQTGFVRPSASQQNFVSTSSPQVNNMVPQSVQTGLVRAPAVHLNSLGSASNAMQSHLSQVGFGRPPTPPQMNTLYTTSARANIVLPQSAQVGFLRPPTSQLNSMPSSAPQTNNTLPQSVQSGFVRAPASQNPNFGGQQTPLTKGLNHQDSTVQNNNVVNQVQSHSPGIHGASTVTGPGLPNSDSSALATDWLTSKSSGPVGVVTSQVPNHDAYVDRQDPVLASTQTAKDSKVLVASGNGFYSDPVLGGDSLSTQVKQELSVPRSESSLSNPSTIALATPGSQNLVNQAHSITLQGMPTSPPATTQFQRAQSAVKPNQSGVIQNASALAVSSAHSSHPSTGGPTQHELPWPKFTQSDIRKYAKVFLEVDKDRDGKITGPEARNLFLSWRLPREVLRQVWDLSDQDNDSMLSMKEFCIAVYLMERYREGRPLPSVLPNSVKFDQILILATGQQPSAYGASAWQPRPAISQQPITGHLSVVPPTVLETSPKAIPPHSEDIPSTVQQKSRVPILEQELLNQLSEDEQKSLDSKLQEATDADHKVQELEKDIEDCRQKIENYRKQMQELVLYKSRCDSRLIETMERAAADKHEVEQLARKYEDKYKQMGDVASKLTLDQATFRDIQEKKMELYSAIAKMEQGETSDTALQDRAEKIQTDLDELVQALNERCKEYGLRAKPTSLMELPFGWQPGIQEGAADWDERWDKFDNDDGFTIIKELTLEVENVVAPERLKPTLENSAQVPAPIASHLSENSAKDKEPASLAEVEHKSDNSLSSRELITETELAKADDEDGLTKASPVSPGKSAIDSPSQGSTSPQHTQMTEKESDHDGADSTVTSEKFIDDIAWGSTFDNDETDSIWGLNPIRTKVRSNPRRAGSPSAASVFGKERPFFDSVPRFSFDDSDPFGSGPFRHDHSLSIASPDSGLLRQDDSLFSKEGSSSDPFALSCSYHADCLHRLQVPAVGNILLWTPTAVTGGPSKKTKKRYKETDKPV
ncbi:hypothetical protein HPP92_022381 [Vanilla planifolia]|uniref:Uncharacterized protein n=1 Tax=Vanilla planifolia TaxID=51239 RepID=A0A835PUM9_VANPL|nr:hypothetical protein HPP92_022381 [Vanilla planifolia]